MKTKRWPKILLGIPVLLLLAIVCLVVYLTATEYRPDTHQNAEWVQRDETAPAVENDMTIYSWNIGYAGLGADSDFFMDGGTMVNPPSGAVERNLAAIQHVLSTWDADVWLLQEVDIDSARSGHVNELTELSSAFSSSYALAYNYRCAFVPFPFPPIGSVASGVATLTQRYLVGLPERISLPCPFSWPVRTANLKRCLLVTRLATADPQRDVVLVNLHLEAYDDGEGKTAQTRLLMEFLQQEYQKGNYVIAGGDFNQVFPDTLETYPLNQDTWIPGMLEENALPAGFRYVYDPAVPTCRLLDQPYHVDSQTYVLDGFIVSPNVQVNTIETIDLSFQNADHNPVKLCVTLLPE